eukprot:scaffold9339_cov91-Skeletonema_dohrnii-CCMP3373.AAC.2
MVARDTPNVEVPGSSPGCPLTAKQRCPQCFIIFNIRRLLSGNSTSTGLIVRRCRMQATQLTSVRLKDA